MLVSLGRKSPDDLNYEEWKPGRRVYQNDYNVISFPILIFRVA